MTRVVTFALIVLAALVALRAVRGEGAAEAKAVVANQRADSAFALAIQHENALSEELQNHALAERRLVAQRDSLQAVAKRAAAQRPAIVARIREVAGDSTAVVAQVAELEAVHQQEVEAYRAQIVGMDALLASKDSVITEYAHVNADLRLAVIAARQASREWEHASKPGFLGIHVRPEVAFVGGVVVGAAFVMGLR